MMDLLIGKMEGNLYCIHCYIYIKLLLVLYPKYFQLSSTKNQATNNKATSCLFYFTTLVSPRHLNFNLHLRDLTTLKFDDDHT